MDCSQCGGSGKILSKRSTTRVVCPCCHGEGKAPAHAIVAEVAVAEHRKRQRALAEIPVILGRGDKTGSYPAYRH